jgi:hypothetical protein
VWLPQVGPAEGDAVDQVAAVFGDLGAPAERARADFGGKQRPDTVGGEQLAELSRFAQSQLTTGGRLLSASAAPARSGDIQSPQARRRSRPGPIARLPVAGCG